LSLRWGYRGRKSYVASLVKLGRETVHRISPINA
jgi:hypothetical protein